MDCPGQTRVWLSSICTALLPEDTLPTLVINCRMLGASKGCLNVSISYSTHPSDHTSLCSSSADVTTTTSGSKQLRLCQTALLRLTGIVDRQQDTQMAHVAGWLALALYPRF